MGEKKVRPPKLPAGAPRELKDFLACKIMEVDLDPAAAGWIPKPDVVPDGLTPTITPTPNGANAVTVSVAWGVVSITLPITLSDGQLQIGATNMPGQEATPGKDAIDNWVKSFNDSLKSNYKELSGLEIRDGKIHLTKRVIASPDASTPETQATSPETPTPAAAQQASTQPPAEGEGMKPRRLIAILSAVVLLGAGITLFITRGGDDAPDASAPTSSLAPTTTAGPRDEAQICANLAILKEVLAKFGTDAPCTIDPDDFWEACHDYMPCFRADIPLIVITPEVGITHDGSVPDATTGQTGPSQAEHSVQVVGPLFDETAMIEVTSQCGGNTINGQSSLTSTAVTFVRHPLFNFGECRAEVFYRSATKRQVIGSYDFSASDAVTADGKPDIAGISAPTETSLNAAGTTLGLLGGKPLDPNCTWFSTQGSALSLAECIGDRWVFNAGHNDPRVLAFGAGYINPVGVVGPSTEQLTPFGPSRLFGNGTLLPCGPGHLGYTACAANEVPVETSGFVAGSVSLAQRVDELAVDTYIEVGVDEYWLRLTREANTWVLTSSSGDDDSQSRAILRGNSITFMIPYTESLSANPYTLTVGDETDEIEQTPQPVLGLVTSTQGPETEADFFRDLSFSIASSDLTFALDRLHPLVMQAFPGEACRTELSIRATPDYQITLDAVGVTETWTWELPDGRSFDVENATTVVIRLPGSPDPVEAHVVEIDRKFYWFTVCDAR